MMWDVENWTVFFVVVFYNISASETNEKCKLYFLVCSQIFEVTFDLKTNFIQLGHHRVTATNLLLIFVAMDTSQVIPGMLITAVPEKELLRNF